MHPARDDTWPRNPADPNKSRRCHDCGLIGTIREILVMQGCRKRLPGPCWIRGVYFELADELLGPDDERAA